MDDKEKYLEMSEYSVVKANDLIQKSRFNLSTQQQKIVLFMISQIKPTDEDFKTYEFSISDFCRVCGIDDTSGGNYQSIKKAIKEISDKSVWLDLQDTDGTETLVRWIEQPVFKKKTGKIYLQLNSHLKPYLLQLKRNFTQYQLLWTLQFKSKYSIRLYELIRSYMFSRNPTVETTRVFELEELKKALGAENHKIYQNFRARVLLPAVQEINKNSNIWLDYETIKTGKAITHIKFYFSEEDFAIQEVKRKNIERTYGLNQLTLSEF